MNDRVRFALRDAVQTFPTLRIGQLIWLSANGEDLFYMTDERLAELLRTHIKDFS